jgi:hypothetical protein
MEVSPLAHSKVKGLEVLQYIDYFMKLDCAGEFLKKKLYPNARDITEAVAALAHSLRHFPELKESGSAKDVIVVVGEGETPRISSLFCACTKGYQVLSIDPKLKPSPIRFQNLTLFARPIQQVRVRASRVWLILMHAHVPIHDVCSSIAEGDICGVFAAPCCDFHESQGLLLGNKPDFQKLDGSIAAHSNLVRIWNCRNRVRPPLDPNDLYSLLKHEEDLVASIVQDRQLNIRNKTPHTIFGIVSRTRFFGKCTIFADLWQPSKDANEEQFGIISELSRKGRLPSEIYFRKGLDSVALEPVPSCLQLCLSQSQLGWDDERFKPLLDYSKLHLRNGNAIRVSGQMGMSKSGFIVFYVDSLQLLKNYLEISAEIYNTL